MYIVDIKTSLASASFRTLGELQSVYKWPDSVRRVFERYLGLTSACLHPEDDVIASLKRPLEQLILSNPELVENTDYVVYAHSLHSTIISLTDHGKLQALVNGLFTCTPEVFSITQGACASGLLALKLLDPLVTSGKRAVLLTGEKCFHSTVQYVERHGVFGEISCAVYLSSRVADMTCGYVAEIAVQTAGHMCDVQVLNDKARLAGYDKAFIPTLVNTVELALAKAGLSTAHVDTIVPYHASPITFERLAKALGLNSEVVFRRHLFHIGHCFCGDTFVNLCDLMAEGSQSRIILAPAVGASGTFCIALIRIEPGNGIHKK